MAIFVELTRIGDVHIYENPRAMPRVMLATCAIHVDFAAMRRAASGRRRIIARRCSWRRRRFAIRARTAPPRDGEHSLLQQHRDRSSRPTRRRAAAGLSCNDVWHPWWFASLDGVAGRILRANVIFRAVPIPEGRHEIHFVFQPLKGLLRELSRRYRANVGN